MILFLLAQSGCVNKSQILTGRVVDESGNPLSGVAVLACYSGWGWSREQLVWDKSYCSEPSLTNDAGNYVINFTGPVNMSLYARKENWLQLQDFHSNNSYITLTSLEEHNATRRTQEKLLESAFQQRQPDESETAYYCRVVLNRVHPINIEYQGESISITPAFLVYGDSDIAFFALRGSSRSASSLAREVQVMINARPISVSYAIQSGETFCDSDIYMIKATIMNLISMSDDRIEMLLPGIQAGWDMKIWDIQ
jgi:hypothetical protein